MLRFSFVSAHTFMHLCIQLQSFKCLQKNIASLLRGVLSLTSQISL